ncbi:MAG: PAS domain-containing protein, partial [Acidobacteriaceae bacterium]
MTTSPIRPAKLPFAQERAGLRYEAGLERHRLQDLLALAPAGIGLLSGPEHRWTYVNEQYVRVTRRTSASEFVGKTLRESLPEMETKAFCELLDEAYQSGEPYTVREMKVRLDHAAKGVTDEAYFDFVCQPIRDTEGTVDGILIHCVEVTDKVAARKAIEETAERFQLAQAAAQIGTWEWDAVENTRSLSPELHRIFGTEASDPDQGEVWASRVYREDRARVRQMMEDGHRLGSLEFEYRYEHPELGLRWFY